MNRYISHYSATAFWNIPYIESVLGYKANVTDMVDITVSRRKERSGKKNEVIHFSKLDLPSGAVILKDDLKVASPELLFLQLGSKLDIHREILLGIQLCSHPPGEPTVAITTKRKLKNFIAKTPRHRGCQNALQALRYIENGSASIMESLAYMILTLPHTLGGYGLYGAVFNHEIKLAESGIARLGQKRCFADLYYKSHRLAVEYDSFTFHSSPMMQGKDIVRSAILERQGVDVMSLSTIQLYSKEPCMDFAQNLASRLGRRIQIRTKKFNQMHEHLRKLLPSGGLDGTNAARGCIVNPAVQIYE